MTKQSHSVVHNLNQLLVLHHRSLPMYLGDVAPWSSSASENDRAVKQVLEPLMLDHQHYTGRYVDAILERDGELDFGGYPAEFTDLHLLSFEYLLKILIEYQYHDVHQIEQLQQHLRSDLEAYHLASESLGNARGHLESLLECSAAISSETSESNTR